MTSEFLEVGERFLDRYRIEKVIGTGGMSRVYGAVQDGIDRKVAIKVLAPVGAESFSDTEFDRVTARFEREAQICSKFRSPHTVVMYDYGRVDDLLYMILEHIDGINLAQLVARRGALPPDRAVRVLRQSLASLAEAHELGILHRDIKPQNIMVFEHLGDPDFVKVLDFGIAKAFGAAGRQDTKLTAERSIIGTPSYMSPEQILDHELTPASDLYSLGLVAYELIFGLTAVKTDSHVSTMARHLAPTPIEIPDDGRLPEGLRSIIRRMIAKDVAERYQSAQEVLADLQRWDGDTSATSLPRVQKGEVASRDAPSGNRPLVVTAALLLVGVAVLTGIAFSLFSMMNRSEPESDSVAMTEPEPPAAALSEVPARPAEPPPLDPSLASENIAAATVAASERADEEAVEADSSERDDDESKFARRERKAAAPKPRKRRAKKEVVVEKTEPAEEPASNDHQERVRALPKADPKPESRSHREPEPEPQPKKAALKKEAPKKEAPKKKETEEREAKPAAPPLSF